jgi:hypothetical protein
VDSFGKVIGILVFLAGMTLLGWVFTQVYHFPDLFAEALRNPLPPNSGEEALSPLVRFLSEQGIRLLSLLGLGVIASLIAHKGAVLIGALRGRKEES